MKREYEVNDSRIFSRRNKTMPVSIEESFFSEYLGSELAFGKLENSEAVAIKFSRIPGGAKREYAGLVLTYDNEIRVPKPLAFIKRDEEPKEGIIMDKIVGKSLAEEPSREARLNLGRELRKMHTINLPGFGIIENGAPQFEESNIYIDSWLEKVMPHLDQNSEGKSLLLELRDETNLYVAEQPPVFLQRDVNENNVIVDSDKKITLIDFEWWQGGNPMDDLATYLYHNIRQEHPETNFIDVLKGYTEEQGLTDNQKLDLLFHTVLGAGRVVRLCAIMNPSRLNEAQQDFDKTVNFVKTKLRGS